MTTINNIMVAIDLSPSSLDALDLGFEITACLNAQITLTHCIEIDFFSGIRELIGTKAESIVSKAIENSREQIETLASNPVRNRGISARIHVDSGLAFNVISKQSELLDTNLLVTGYKGENEAIKFGLGTTSSRLLRKSRCPVLIARNPCEGPYRTILIPVDFSHSSEMSIQLAKKIAPQSDVVLLHVFDMPYESKLRSAGITSDEVSHYKSTCVSNAFNELNKLAVKCGIENARYRSVVEIGHASKLIPDYSKQTQFDLIVMGKHGTHVTDEMLLGSVTKHVLNSSNADVLVVIDSRTPSLDLMHLHH